MCLFRIRWRRSDRLRGGYQRWMNIIIRWGGGTGSTTFDFCIILLYILQFIHAPLICKKQLNFPLPKRMPLPIPFRRLKPMDNKRQQAVDLATAVAHECLHGHRLRAYGSFDLRSGAGEDDGPRLELLDAQPHDVV